MTKTSYTADVRPAKGYVALDGVTYETQKAAITASHDFKVMAALKDFAAACPSFDGTEPKDGATFDDRDNPVLYQDGLATFIFVHRNAILAALKQEVSLRKPYARKPKTPAAPGLRGAVLTQGDADADLAGTPRPNNATVSLKGTDLPIAA